MPAVAAEELFAGFGFSEAEWMDAEVGGPAWNEIVHGSSREDHRYCSRAFVVPEVQGWALVFGRTGHDVVVAERTAELSGRFGTAYWYGVNCSDGWAAWCIAEAGEVIRHYDYDNPLVMVGAPHPAEAGLRLPHEPSGLPDEAMDTLDITDAEALATGYQRLLAEYGVPEVCDTQTVAGRTSVDPEEIEITGPTAIVRTSCRQ
ncbi:hypothetical protein HPO96_08720 [Kribbella sandramycini]|uniref:Uncharacterized protein n=1 Tax=Kribbella sandramycini TaxID=60450 RepID=A0A7Y4NZQ5_9ACTN|nr:hypothetical protein [Kribbella sandramycini]MBB6569850.1 hypothetical protein [Kribbella sandramycini]NOL40325.1 hypothetical protein [Kribbella sandramycini]